MVVGAWSNLLNEILAIDLFDHPLAFDATSFAVDGNGNLIGLPHSISFTVTFLLFVLVILASFWLIALDVEWRLVAILGLIICLGLLGPAL